MSQEEDRVRGKAISRTGEILHDHASNDLIAKGTKIVDQILSIKGLRIEALKQTLPNVNLKWSKNCTGFDAYTEAQQDMLKDNWVKAIGNIK